MKIPVVTARQRRVILGDVRTDPPKRTNRTDVRYHTFEALLRTFGVLAPEREHVFYPGRKWRADYCWPQHKLAVEIDGGVFMRGGGGRHNHPGGFKKDQEKRNAYAMLGYRVMTFRPEEARNGKAAQLVRHWFAVWTTEQVGKPNEGDQVCRR